ncbi:MAG: winged helix-turn-helix domain-containing protein [Pseudomonadota bacterium]
MLYRFADCTLDPARRELRRGPARVEVEPQVFDLLRLLIEARERVVRKDEIVEAIWGGRAISDAAITTRIRSARQAIGDDGREQRAIATLHRVGYRFVAAVEVLEPAAALAEAEPPAPPPEAPSSRPSIAVLPFDVVGGGYPDFPLSEAIPHDLIAELSRLRWLFVIARGSSFQFRGPDVSMAEISARLGARYCLTGSVEAHGARLAITVELISTEDAGVVFSERFEGPTDDIHAMRARVAMSVVAGLELEIPMHEARAAQLTSPEVLDAWSAYHLGLQHLYRMRAHDNAAAASLFERATRLDPSFARAHAALSATHAKGAFFGYSEDRAVAVAHARAAAERGVELDPRDPYVNITMGRSLYLAGDVEASHPWLDRATAVNPNYAHGFYSRGWALTMAGRGAEARACLEKAMRLSPLDPLHYAFQATRALSHLDDGETAQAAIWADRAARGPGAHSVVLAAAAAAHALNGDDAGAQAWVEALADGQSVARPASILRNYPFRKAQTRRRIADALTRLGL